MDLKKQIFVTDLVNQVENHMCNLKYSKYTLKAYRSIWNAIINHAKDTGEKYMTSELGVKTLKKHFNIDIYSSNLSKYQKALCRAIAKLLEFQETGQLVKHKDRYEFPFPELYAETAHKFLKYLETDLVLKPQSIRNYYMNLNKFLVYCDFNGAKTVRTINSDVVNNYLRTYAGYAKSYINTQIRTFQRFLEFAKSIGETDIIFNWPKVTIYKDKDIPNYYKAEEIKAILETVDRANPLGKRDYAILLLATKYGLRSGDIKLLEFSNIDFNTNQINIRQQKTDKPLSLFLLPEVGWALIDYIQNGRPKSDCERVFIRHKAPYDGFEYNGSLGQVLQKYVQVAGVKSNPKNKNNFHMLRYSLASDLLRKNVPLTVISGILGHSELNITAKYTRLDFNQLKECSLEVPV